MSSSMRYERDGPPRREAAERRLPCTSEPGGAAIVALHERSASHRAPHRALAAPHVLGRAPCTLRCQSLASTIGVTALIALEIFVACERDRPTGPLTPTTTGAAARAPAPAVTEVKFDGKCDVTTAVAEIGADKEKNREVTIKNTGTDGQNCPLVVSFHRTGAPGSSRILQPGSTITFTLEKKFSVVIRRGQLKSDRTCKGTYIIK